MLKYRSTTGIVSVERVNSGGAGTTFRGSETWTKGWSAFSPYAIGGQGHVLIYKIGTGVFMGVEAQRRRVRHRYRLELGMDEGVVLSGDQLP